MNKLYRQTQYLRSVYSAEHLPAEQGIEIAFAGRSNAGKSSAINTITDHNRLAHVSRTPGRTQMINYFQITDDKYLVDLPGYGFAKVPKAVREHWNLFLDQYFQTRQSLKGLILVMDIRRKLEEQDWQMVEWAVNSEIPLHILLSKADKLKRSEASHLLFKTQKLLEENGVAASLQLFSAKSRLGLEDVHSLLDEWFGINQHIKTL